MCNKIWKFIYNMHLYDTKGEGFFKAIIITISWIGGVNTVKLNEEISVPMATSLFLFSAALIMEYAVRLVVSKKLATRIFPLIILMFSTACVTCAFGVLVNKPLGIGLETLYDMTIYPQWIIWLDVVVQLLIDEPNDKSVETMLKGVEMG